MRTQLLLAFYLLVFVICVFLMGYIIGQRVEQKRHWPYVLPLSLQRA